MRTIAEVLADSGLLNDAEIDDNFSKDLTFDIGFINPHEENYQGDGIANDETELTAGSATELDELYADFCRENDLPEDTVMFIEVVGEETEEETPASFLVKNFGNMCSVPLGDGYALVAEANPERDYKEIFIYLQSPDGTIYQDLAIVGEEYEYNAESGDIIPRHGEYSVKVYSDSLQEDFTHDFLIERYKEEEDA